MRFGLEKFSIKPIKNKDITILWAIGLGLILFVAKLVLSRAQNVYLAPDASGLDDMMMYNAAVSITKGEWLGAYNWMTLSKHSFYALWLAVLHWLGIPALAGGQILWAGVSVAAGVAVAPVVKKRWLVFLLYAFLLFNPASLGNPSPMGFVSRIYRDNIFPALCLLCVAGMIGAALRYNKSVWNIVGWFMLAGVAFAACWLCREDGWWLLPFVVVAAIVFLLFVIRGDAKNKGLRIASVCVPFVFLFAGTLAWRTANYVNYGRFIISDFSSGEFADAYGALTRITSNEKDSEQAVPKDVRDALYELVPEFAELKPYLEDDGYMERYGNYNAGGFYWALREAAQQVGVYDTPKTAQGYFETLANKVNALCDANILPAGPKRSSVSPAIKAEYILPVSKEALHSLVFCATFQQSNPQALFSPGSNDATFYQEKIRPMEEFLREKAITVTHPNTEEPVYTQFQNISYKLLNLIRVIYSILLPLALVAALLWQVFGAMAWAKRRKKKQPDIQQNLFWIVQLGLLFCILLRAYMIAFVTVVSFEIGTYIMYLSSIHPLMILYAFCGTVALIRYFINGKSGEVEEPHVKGAKQK